MGIGTEGAAQLQRALDERVHVLHRRILEQPAKRGGVVALEERGAHVEEHGDRHVLDQLQALAVGEERVPYEHRVTQVELAPEEQPQPAQQVQLRLHLVRVRVRVRIRVGVG